MIGTVLVLFYYVKTLNQRVISKFNHPWVLRGFPLFRLVTCVSVEF